MPVTSVPFGSLDLSDTVLLVWNGSSIKKEVNATWAISADRQVRNAITPDRINSPGPTGNTGSAAERFNLANESISVGGMGYVKDN
jgi:hypothetical protein